MTVPQPRLLDLFCGAGGCTAGYQDAGFYVVGVDSKPQPNYCGDAFHQGDALEVLREWHFGTFDAIHASPPCQSYSKAMKHLSDGKPQLIEPVRALLAATGLPWIIENVEGAPLPRAETLDGRYGLELCGTMFGLRAGWHRLFETSFAVRPPYRPCRCSSTHLINPFFSGGRDRIYAEFGQGDRPDWPEVVWRRERGTAWMGRYEGREAVPPAYTEFIGTQLLAHVRHEVAA